MLPLRKTVAALSETRPQTSELIIDKMEPDDQLVGTLTEDLRSLYILMIRAGQSLREALDRHDKAVGGTDNTKLDPEVHRRLDHECDLRQLEYGLCYQEFWTCLRLTFPDKIARGSIALRSGWQVVIPSARSMLLKDLGSMVDRMFAMKAAAHDSDDVVNVEVDDDEDDV